MVKSAPTSVFFTIWLFFNLAIQLRFEESTIKVRPPQPKSDEAPMFFCEEYKFPYSRWN